MVQFAQLFLSLTILITLHEFGHFFFARLFKTRVEKFYLFFDFLFPFANIAKFAIFKKKIGDTEYGLGWFPFGGYVQISGMVDEQMDASGLEGPAQPWEMRSKPAWQRLLIMMGGILVNVILGILIFWMVLFTWGKDTIPLDQLKNGIACDSVAIHMGLRDGDKILSIDNQPVTSLHRVSLNIIMNKAKSIQVERQGQKVEVPVSDHDISVILKNSKKSPFIIAETPTEVDSVMAGSSAQKAGLRKGDFIIGINGKLVPFFGEFRRTISSLRGKPVELSVLRGQDTIKLRTTVEKEGNLGFLAERDKYITTVNQSYTFGEALGQSFADARESIVMQIKQFVVIFTVEDAHQQVGGFYSMYKSMNSEWNWRDFWQFTGFLSLVLAFMNFLPIPMLDGGYILFILLEMIMRRKIPEKVIYYANYVGLILILGLMIYANTDWLRHWND
jgi:regulator of sigma E protease